MAFASGALTVMPECRDRESGELERAHEIPVHKRISFSSAVLLEVSTLVYNCAGAQLMSVTS
jgi:hypothetical protein